MGAKTPAVEFVRELDPYQPGQRACLVRRGNEHFVVSSIATAPDHGGPETLAFAADADGEVTSWADVAGGRGWSREETIAELASKGPDVSAKGRGLFGDTKALKERDDTEVVAGVIAAMGVVARCLAGEDG